MKPETRNPKPETADRGEVIARCPKCGEPVTRGRCTNIVTCAYTLPEARTLTEGHKGNKGSASFPSLASVQTDRRIA
jgi:hypothetical protein